MSNFRIEKLLQYYFAFWSTSLVNMTAWWMDLLGRDTWWFLSMKACRALVNHNWYNFVRIFNAQFNKVIPLLFSINNWSPFFFNKIMRPLTMWGWKLPLVLSPPLTTIKRHGDWGVADLLNQLRKKRWEGNKNISWTNICTETILSIFSLKYIIEETIVRLTRV